MKYKINRDFDISLFYWIQVQTWCRPVVYLISSTNDWNVELSTEVQQPSFFASPFPQGMVFWSKLCPLHIYQPVHGRKLSEFRSSSVNLRLTSFALFHKPSRIPAQTRDKLSQYLCNTREHENILVGSQIGGITPLFFYLSGVVEVKQAAWRRRSGFHSSF